MRAISGRRDKDVLRVAVATGRLHPVSKPMSARERQHLRHLGRMMEEVPIVSDGRRRGPSAALADCISQSKRAPLRRFYPTEHGRPVRRDGPIRLQAARPGWIRKRGDGKSLAEGRQRQHGAQKYRLDLHLGCSSFSIRVLAYIQATSLVSVPIFSMVTETGPPSLFRSIFCTAPPCADFLSAVPIEIMSPGSSVKWPDRNFSTSGIL